MTLFLLGFALAATSTFAGFFYGIYYTKTITNKTLKNELIPRIKYAYKHLHKTHKQKFVAWYGPDYIEDLLKRDKE